MYGIVKFNIFRNDEFIYYGARKHNEVATAVMEFLKLCNDDANYEVVGWIDGEGCVLDVWGNIDCICKMLINNTNFNI